MYPTRPRSRHATSSLLLSSGTLRCLVLWLALAALAGCLSDRNGDAAGAELVIAAPGDAYDINVGSDIGIDPVNVNIYEPLIRLTPTYQLEPMLATSWEFRPPNTWRFRLREGVRMHDGSAFTADAVEWSMRRIPRPDRDRIGIGDGSVRRVDDYTVEITPTRPNRRLLQQLAHPNWSIMAPGTEPATKPVGTGPFQMVEYVRGDHLTVERFSGYWGQMPKLERLTFRFLPDPNTRVLALRSGDAHVAYDLPRESARSVARIPGLKVVSSPVSGYEALYVNIHGRPPYDLGRDKAVRR
ncbi:MAG TPA: ABC transporter substrate-binding protein, partial [Gemmatimonadales bacterium]|nr:ABC transporter substrate-binding protein [Gemmatimonadales bacterium]